MNILVLTTIYSDPEDTVEAGTSPVVHNFAREWVKSGHNVLLIHNFNTFLLPMYYVPKKIYDLVSNKVGFRTTLNPKQRKQIHYVNEGVRVYRVPVLKVVPMGPYSKGRLVSQYKRIIKILNDTSFSPDVIVAHAENPQVYQLYELKKRYPDSITCLVFHGVDYLGRPQFKKWREEYLPTIDKFGFRSESILRKAKDVLGFNRDYFMCPSGIANEYVIKSVPKSSRKIRKIIYVGQLIERKHLKTLIEALSRFPERGYELTVVGVGPQKEEDEQLARVLGVNARFLGKLPHGTVIDEMSKSDCFVMVSENEVFGLVYLEAMAQGCITIASEKEGMEGIIQNGGNGFLTKAGDIEGLASVFDTIENMEEIEIIKIRNAALELARQYSETNVAENYLKNVTSR